MKALITRFQMRIDLIAATVISQIHSMKTGGHGSYSRVENKTAFLFVEVDPAGCLLPRTEAGVSFYSWGIIAVFGEDADENQVAILDADARP